MNYWLVKSEAEVYSLSQLKKDKFTQWTDVRNYQARNNLREMKVGDKVLYYHSNSKPSSIVGVAEVKKTAYPDPGQFDPKSDYYDAKSKTENPSWVGPDLKFLSELSRSLSLEELRKQKALSQMELFKYARLSVQKVAPSEFRFILELAKQNIKVSSATIQQLKQLT